MQLPYVSRSHAVITHISSTQEFKVLPGMGAGNSSGTGNSSEVIFEKFDFASATTAENFIDRGAFGEVYGPFTWNNKQFAFKRIWISQGRPGDDLKTKLEDKRNIWTSLKHKNLIEIHKIILSPKELYIVMEYASGGSLGRLIDSSDGTYYRKISNWSRQIAQGMLYLHEKDIVHRDLKSNNIMLSEPFDPLDADKEVTLKITDFDEAREHGHTTTMSFRGTCAYMAPEVLKTERFSKFSDVWSYGVVVWEMFTGKRAHEDLVDGEIMQKALSGQLMLPIPESVPRAYEELLHGCLHNDKNSRLSCQDIIDKLYNIEKRVKRRSEYKLDPVLIQTIKTKAAEEVKKRIMGLTILDKDLFVVSQLSSEVEVYDSMKISFSRRWNLKEMTNPLDIVSCNRNKCLYVYDYKISHSHSNEILRVDPNGKLLRKWSAGDDWGLGLSVTDESNIILSGSFKNKINEYSPDGQVLREIKLSSVESILIPRHAIKMTNGHFVVILDDSFGSDLHKVCIVDEYGKLKKSFGENLGSTSGQMNRPVYLAVDGNGFVLVADRGNSRILLLDSDLEFKSEILTGEKHGLLGPQRILLDESNNRLFVVDDEWNFENGRFEDGRILIFEFR